MKKWLIIAPIGAAAAAAAVLLSKKGKGGEPKQATEFTKGIYTRARRLYR